MNKKILLTITMLMTLLVVSTATAVPYVTSQPTREKMDKLYDAVTRIMSLPRTKILQSLIHPYINETIHQRVVEAVSIMLGENTTDYYPVFVAFLVLITETIIILFGNNIFSLGAIGIIVYPSILIFCFIQSLCLCWVWALFGIQDIINGSSAWLIEPLSMVISDLLGGFDWTTFGLLGSTILLILVFPLAIVIFVARIPEAFFIDFTVTLDDIIRDYSSYFP